jgi:hypothetical protein
LAPGTYYVQVYIRSAGSPAKYEVAKSMSYTITPPPATGGALAALPATSQVVGTPVDFSASGEGGSGTYEYQYFWRSASGVWTSAGPYSTTSTWHWDTTGLAPGTYYVQVYIRSAGSPAKYEVAKSMSYTITPPPATGGALAALPATSQVVGTPVDFSVSGQGGSGTYEYQYFWRSASGVWTSAGPYSAASTWRWDTTGLAPGTYYVQVYIRSVGSQAKYEAAKSMSYQLK